MEAKKRTFPGYFSTVTFISLCLIIAGAIGFTDNLLHLLVPSANTVASYQTYDDVRQKLLDDLLSSISLLLVCIPIFLFHFPVFHKQWKKQHE